jgi:hypothetical protein
MVMNQTYMACTSIERTWVFSKHLLARHPWSFSIQHWTTQKCIDWNNEWEGEGRVVWVTSVSRDLGPINCWKIKTPGHQDKKSVSMGTNRDRGLMMKWWVMLTAMPHICWADPFSLGACLALEAARNRQRRRHSQPIASAAPLDNAG